MLPYLFLLGQPLPEARDLHHIIVQHPFQSLFLCLVFLFLLGELLFAALSKTYDLPIQLLFLDFEGHQLLFVAYDVVVPLLYQLDLHGRERLVGEGF